jgi:peptidoglycan hydrolase-like protein with peptidoglycan-binding domain
MRGDDVRSVQQALLAAGFDPGPIDSIYGPRTANQVARFQASRGLPSTGVVCGQTYVKLGVNCAAIPPCPLHPEDCRALVTTNPFLRGSDVRNVQEALAARGFNPGPIDGIYPELPMRGSDVAAVQIRLANRGFDVGQVDGIFGPHTENQVIPFQRAVGLDVTGVVTADVYRALAIRCTKIG